MSSNSKKRRNPDKEENDDLDEDAPSRKRQRFGVNQSGNGNAEMTDSATSSNIALPSTVGRLGNIKMGDMLEPLINTSRKKCRYVWVGRMLISLNINIY